MSLLSDINQLQLIISRLVLQAGIHYKYINLSLRSKESGYEVLSLIWNSQLITIDDRYSSIISQDKFVKGFIDSIFKSGLNPAHCLISICVEDINFLSSINWKFRENKRYLQISKKCKGVKFNILFRSIFPESGSIIEE